MLGFRAVEHILAVILFWWVEEIVHHLGSSVIGVEDILSIARFAPSTGCTQTLYGNWLRAQSLRV